MAAASSSSSVSSSTTKLRSPFSTPNLLLSVLNFTLLLLAAASIPPVILLRTPPTSMGMAFLAVSGITVLSSLVGFYSQLNHLCFVTHLSLLLASLSAQVLSVLALFSKEESSLELLRPARNDPREAKLLVRLECGVMVAMAVVQAAVLVLGCAVHHCWVREYAGLEAERDATARKRSSRRRRMARVVQEEESAAELEEVKVVELDEKLQQGKYGKWTKTDFDG
ncbi:unnamed protein product [Linum tenue]|uniref:Membrane lipoprotein n=1 Tax=Linum tenue TaxID=586396 RepID=A0AAV0S3U5_9ROSI|nr:unnamed protein product [Linum tenue]